MDLDFLDQKTKDQIINLFKNNRQTILFQTNENIKKRAIVDLLKSSFKKANFVSYQPIDGKIKIDIIRQINSELLTKRSQRQFIIIEQAEKMNQAAQNAFLKSLEEPIRGVFFLLFTNQPELLLSTVRSRAIYFKLAKTSKQQLAEKLSKNTKLNKQQISQICFLTSDFEQASQLASKPKLLSQKKQLVEQAKIMIEGELEQKLLVTSQYFKDREQAIELIKMMISLYRVLLVKNYSKRLHHQTTAALEAVKKLDNNQSVKLVLTKLALA